MASHLKSGPCQGVLSPTDKARALSLPREGSSLIVFGTTGDGASELADDIAHGISGVDTADLWLLEMRGQVPPSKLPCVLVGPGATHLTGSGGAVMLHVATQLGLGNTEQEAIDF
jgi:hypothetical protein